MRKAQSREWGRSTVSNTPDSQVLSGQRSDHWVEQHERDKNLIKVVSREKGDERFRNRVEIIF